MSGINPNNGASATNNKNPTDSRNQTVNPVAQHDTLGEDDEFEDFPVENWTVAESDISSLANPVKQTTVDGESSNNKNSKKVTMDDLWEDNWDDDVVESDFAHQLRAELEKSKTHDGPAPMQT